MSFANFYVGQNEITKQFKGCYGQPGPLRTAVGTLGGTSFSASGVKDVLPLKHNSVPGLWVFPGVDAGYVKMVGMKYGGDGKAPVRVDGRAYPVKEGTIPELTGDTVSGFWDNAPLKNITSDEYSLTISNNSPLKSINTCLHDASEAGSQTFSVSDINGNGIGYCQSGPNVENGQKTLLQGVSEKQCLAMPDANTVYSVTEPAMAKNILGKTFMGKKAKDGEKMVFYEYPSTLLDMGKGYEKHEGYDSKGGDLADGTIKDATSEECKQYCLNKGDGCKGFVYDTIENICSLKETIYPSTKRTINKSLDIYTRMPSVKNSPLCPKEIRSVNTDFISKNGLLSKDQMSLDFHCETENGLEKQVDSIEKAYSLLTEEVAGLRQENNNLLKGFTETRKDVQKHSDEYDDVKTKLGRFTKNATLERMLMDAKQLETVFSMNNTGFILVMVLLSIILVRVLRK